MNIKCVISLASQTTLNREKQGHGQIIQKNQMIFGKKYVAKIFFDEYTGRPDEWIFQSISELLKSVSCP